MSRSRSVACTLLILIVMATPGAWAAAHQEVRRTSLNLFERLWEAIVEIWAPAPTADEGCMIDPHGGCRSGS